MKPAPAKATNQKNSHDSANEVNSAKERQFILLGVLLQALHVFFGVTAFLGMFLNVTRLPSIQSSLWQDHCRWQITTFWVGALLYAITITIGFTQNVWWPFVLAAMWVGYRIISSAVAVATHTAIPHAMWPLTLNNSKVKSS